MSRTCHRRGFLRYSAAGGSLLGLANLGAFNKLQPVSAASARLDPAAVRLSPEIEPLVRLLEDTPREELLEKVAGRLREGTTYPDVLAALLLAGVRNVEPRPNVGFKFHAVLVVNSAHLASIDSPDQDRWLPIFWALDYFKDSQARDDEECGWTMGPVDEASVPPPHQARKMFLDAMARWDETAADAAVASLARGQGLNSLYEDFFRLGARDFRSIGHKAIYVANSYRTLQVIGAQHAEPIVRSLAYALLMHEGSNPASRDDPADRIGRLNEERLQSIRPDWPGGTPRPEATTSLLETLREGSPEDASQAAARLLNEGVSPQSLWDALFLGAGELIARQPGIVSLHAATTTNALHFAYQHALESPNRLFALLQNAAFLPLFREAMRGRGPVQDRQIDAIEPAPDDSSPTPESIFAEAGRDRSKAAALTLGYLDKGHAPRQLLNYARRLVFLKGSDSHDYKFSSAAFEDYFHLSPAVRGRYLASAIYLLHSSGDRDNSLVPRIRAALEA